LGTNQSVTVDVRILAATHRDLKELVGQGRFRADLYYRLKILEVQIPPLRERPGDVRLLAQHFLRHHAPPGHHLRLTTRALAILAAHHFPGNVRELENAIRHAIAIAPGDYID